MASKNLRHVAELTAELSRLRSALENAFSPDTAWRQTTGSTTSAGHCGAVAAIVHRRYGGKLLQTWVRGTEHWFNRLATKEGPVDVDLTGDQFGFPPVQIERAGHLYLEASLRPAADLKPETIDRAERLLERARSLGVAASAADGGA